MIESIQNLVLHLSHNNLSIS